MMAIMYVDDNLFWSVDVNDIHDKAMKLRKQGVNLEQEDDAAGFLGVTLGRDGTTGLMEMKQVRIIDRVIETLGLDNGIAKGKFTPAEYTPLVKDTDGEYSCGFFIYSIVVDILFWSVDVNDIHDKAMKLREQGVYL